MGGMGLGIAMLVELVQGVHGEGAVEMSRADVVVGDRALGDGKFIDGDVDGVGPAVGQADDGLADGEEAEDVLAGFVEEEGAGGGGEVGAVPGVEADGGEAVGQGGGCDGGDALVGEHDREADLPAFSEGGLEGRFVGGGVALGEQVVGFLDEAQHAELFARGGGEQLVGEVGDDR